MNDSKKKTFHKNKISITGFLSGKFTDMWNRSLTSTVFCAKNSNSFSSSGTAAFLNKFSFFKRALVAIRHQIASMFDRSIILSGASKLIEMLMTLSLSCYGMFFTFFSFYSLIFYYLKNFAFGSGVSEFSDLYVIVAVLFFSIPLSFVKKSFSASLCESGILSYLFIEVFRCESLERYSQKKACGSMPLSLGIGTLIGLLALMFSHVHIYLFFVFAAVVFLFFCLPESAVLIISLVFPFCGTEILGSLSVLALLSFLLKVIRGKRRLNLSTAALPVILFILMGGLLSSDKNSISLFAIALIYFLFSVIPTDVKFIFRAFKNVILGSGICGFIFITVKAVRIFSHLDFTVPDYFLYSASQNLSLYFAVSSVMAFCHGFLSYKTKKMHYCVPAFVFAFASACLTGSDIIISGVICGIFVFLLVTFQNKLVVLFAGSAVFALFSKISYLLPGENGFYRAYDLMKRYGFYALSGANNSDEIFASLGYNDSGSLWVQLSFWGGVFAFLLIAVEVVFFVRNGFGASVLSKARDEKVLYTAIAAAMTTFTVASVGTFSFADGEVYAMFWIVGGLSTASMRMASKRTEYEKFVDAYS